MITIEEKVINTIYHARKFLLFDKDNVWVKKDNPEFDVTMGSYDGAELCELVGLYLLDLITKEFGKQNIGLYRDDGLSCFENISGPDSEKIKKKLFEIFKSNGLSITVESNNITLKIRGFNKNVTYIPVPSKLQTRKRQIVWFNLPYSANVKTNVGNIFMRLVDKHFPCHHKYYKLFNRSNFKLSYSCMQNMKNIIWKHSSKVMKYPASSTTTKTCNCRQKADCPIGGSCLSECLIYKASLSESTNKYYYGTCENTFRERYNNLKCSFRINLVKRTLNCRSMYGY